MIFKSKTFWIASALFLIIAGGVTWLVILPLISKAEEQGGQLSSLQSQVQSQQQYLATIKNLTKDRTTVNGLFDAANQLLPTNSGSDILSLQLNGLIGSLGLPDMVATVPFTGAVTVTTGGAVSSSTTPQAAGSLGGNSAPIVQGTTPNQLAFTLAGQASFSQAQSLLGHLRTFSRWNKITAIDVNQSGNQVNVTVSANVFSRSVAPTTLSGTNANLLTQAKTLFGQFQSYATTPDIKTEGQFGRGDPFAGH